MSAARGKSHLPIAIAIAAASGFIALSYELVWYRMYSFFTWSAAATFGVLLAAYLLGIAIGSLISRRFCRDRKTEGEPRELVPLGAFFLVANTLSVLVVPIMTRAFTVTWLLNKGLPMGMITLAAGAMGAVLPLTSHFAIAPDDRAGAKLSYLYLANIVGSTAGSLLTGFVFLDAMPMAKTCVVIASIGFATVIAVFLAARGGEGGATSKQVGTGVAASVVLGALVIALGPRLFDQTWERLFYKDKFDGSQRFAEVVENKHGVIAVTEDTTVLGGGAYDGRINTSVRHDRNGIGRAYVLGAMHPNLKEVLMVGLASGAWAEVLSNHPTVEHLTAIEINSGYLEIIERHAEVAPLLKNPKVKIEIDDGRRWLQRHPDRKFDAIVMNTTWNWRAHSTNLLSTEYMQLARAHLAPGGIFYFNTTSSPEAKKTALTTFPYGMRVYNFIAASDSPLALDKTRWKEMLLAWKLEGVPVFTAEDVDNPAYAHILNYPDSVDAPKPREEGLERKESLLKELEGVRVITDDNMATEFIGPLRQPAPI